MGDLIVLKDWHRERTRALAGTLPAFFFDPTCPFSYLAAERVERMLGEVHWVPTAAASLHAPGPPLQVPLHDALERDPLEQTRIVMARAEHQALVLRLPLVWPDRFPAGSPAALRAAAYAAEAVPAPGSRSPRPGWRSAAASTSRIAACSRMRPRPPSSTSTRRWRRRANPALDGPIRQHRPRPARPRRPVAARDPGGPQVDLAASGCSRKQPRRRVRAGHPAAG